MADKRVLQVAARVFAGYERDYAEYLELCEIDRRDGFRSRSCEHGTDNWTDYDNICGACEDGYSMGYDTGRVLMRQMALANARDRVKRADEIGSWLAGGVRMRLVEFDDATWNKACAEIERLLLRKI